MPVYIPPPANDHLSLSPSLGKHRLRQSFAAGVISHWTSEALWTSFISDRVAVALAFCLVFVHSVVLVQLLQGVASAVDIRCACTVLASAQAFRVPVAQASGIVIIPHSRVGC